MGDHEKINIVVLGNLPLATKIIKFVREQSIFELVGVVCPKQDIKYIDNDNELCSYAYCVQNDIPVLSIEEVSKYSNLGIAISARNDAILTSDFLDLFSLGIINCHGGFLPDYKGVGGHIFPILNGEKNSGATIHWMRKEVDRGEIIDRVKVPISDKDTGFSLYLKINDALLQLIKANLIKLINGESKPIQQKELPFSNREKREYYYWKKNVKSEIDSLNDNSTVRQQRALFWPGKPIPNPEYFEGYVLKETLAKQ